jgi:AcrR family transcriptional regulator
MSAADRRESVLEAALTEFALRGLHGTSTEEIADRAGISQPYVFRLFGTKKELFLATIERCFRETHDTFAAAAAGLSGADALKAMGESYRGLVADRSRLMGQLHAYAASDDPDVREAVRRGYGELVELVERVSGAEPAVVAAWFAKGMLINVITAMDVMDSDLPWAQRLIEGCWKA